MSDEKNKVTDKVTDKASEIARNIWLAGVGAYGKAVEEAQERLEKAMEPPKLFRDLVKVGAALEEDARVTTIAARHSVEERINRVRENFHNQRPARIEDLTALHKKVDQLTRKVDRLSKALVALGMGESSRKKARKAPGKSAAQPSPRRGKAGSKKVVTVKPVGKTLAGGQSAPASSRSSASKRKVR